MGPIRRLAVCVGEKIFGKTAVRRLGRGVRVHSFEG